MQLTDHERVRVAKIASVVVGVDRDRAGHPVQGAERELPGRLGVQRGGVSANLPALVMLLFWKRTTRQGIIAAVLVGMVSSLAWILLSGDTFDDVYGLPPKNAPRAVQPAGHRDDSAGIS